MFLVSVRRSPVAPDMFNLSEPARSINERMPTARLSVTVLRPSNFNL